MTTKSNVVPLTQAAIKPHEGAVKMLTELLSWAVAGKLRSLVVVATMTKSECLHSTCLEDASDLSALSYGLDLQKADLIDMGRECECAPSGDSS